MAVQLQTYGTPEEFANFIRRAYAQAETLMISRVASRLVRGIDSAGWAEKKLAETQVMAREVGAAVQPLRELPKRIQDATEKAYDEGVAGAISDLKAANLLAPGFSPSTGAGSGVKALAGAVTGTLEQAHVQILRSTLDTYRNVVAEASAQVLTGTQTRREVAQVVLNRFVDRGVRPFRDKSGRTWDMASYAEMAVRSTTAQAAVQGHLETLSAGGDDLVICSDSTESCPLCNEWEGKVLSISGKSTEYPSVQDAVAAGLLHPNCTHSLDPFVPGLTRKREVEPIAERRKGYQDRQHQRYNERMIRHWKLREAAAITDSQKALASAKVAAWQQRQRDFIADTGRRRDYGREQIKGAR